jgi:hypothetical protein
VHGLHLVGCELVRRRERVDLRAPERLVGVDVPDPGDRALVEDRGLDRRAPGLELLGEVLRLVRGVEWLATDARVEVGVHVGRFEQEPGAEAADVAIGDVRSVV